MKDLVPSISLNKSKPFNEADDPLDNGYGQAGADKQKDKKNK